MEHYTRSNAFHLFQKEDGTKFQTVIPDYYDSGKQIVADAKYIPLQRWDYLSAERAAPIYYKTIMYMYRFNANNGFLFHPCRKKELENLGEEYHQTGENCIHCTYRIDGRENSYLHKVGMVVPEIQNNFAEFSNQMETVERDYVAEIGNLMEHY